MSISKIYSLTVHFLFFLFTFSCGRITQNTATINDHHPVWQWCVKMDNFTSKETNDHPEAYLWIPGNCIRIEGVIFAQNNMIEKELLESPVFRAKMRKLNFAEVWINPMFTQEFNFHKNDPEMFQNILQKLANVSGYTELAEAPVVPIGHSSLATFPWNFAAWNPERTLCVVSIHGDAPQTNLTGYGRQNVDWGSRDIDGVPGLFVMGEYEWMEERLAPGLRYQYENPGSVLTWFANAGHGHFDCAESLKKYIADYIQKAAEYRLPEKPDQPLKKVMPLFGWLIDRWRLDSLPQAKAAPFSEFRGDRYSASWVFDEEMANETEAYYANARQKKQPYN